MMILIEREVVLHKHPLQQSPHFVYFEAKKDDAERTDGYYMTLQQWEDFGKPEVITITAKAGDKLNTPDDT